MELIKLRYFTEVCRYSSMTKAADTLFVSQQNISKAISSLEKELGVPLFIRSGKDLKLTTDGEYLLQKANWILAEANVVDSHFQNKREKGGLITIESSYSLLPRCGAATQQFLLDNRHSYNISYVQRRAEDVEEDVRRGAVRFGLVYQPTQETQFDAITLKEETLCFLVSLEHPLANRKDVSLYQMAQYPMVMPDEHTAAGRLICRMFQTKGLMPYVVLPSLAISEITRLTAANPTFIGCAVESDLACVRTEGLKKITCARKPEKMKLSLIYRRSIPLAKHEKKFRDELCDTFQGESDEQREKI